MTETRFLWGERFAVPDRATASPDGDWWRQYSERLRLSASALAELSDSTRSVADLLPVPAGTSAVPSPVRGLVVGSVQSGKTAHMIGLSARALDLGYKVVVVLAGLKDDLRAQTARRFNTQLLRQRDAIKNSPASFTLSHAEASRRVSALSPPYYLDCHQWHLFHVRMMGAIADGRPLIAVIKKNQASLTQMRDHVRQLWRRFGQEQVPLLVLDDECDEASVEPDEATPTPQLIADLWRPLGRELTSTVSYVGYTATAAANLLQNPDNELYPSDFVVPLRTPANRDSAETFSEPHPHRWYCGGEAFYERLVRPMEGGGSLLVDARITPAELAGLPSDCESLRYAVRLYLLTAAIKSAEWIGAPVAGAPVLGAPHTMIVQASTAISDHERWAEAVRRIIGLSAPTSACDWDRIAADIAANGPSWAEALASINRSRIAVNETHPHPWPLRVFAFDDLVARLKLLVPLLRLRVLNSAPGAVDSLDFDGRTLEDGTRVPPEDMLSIVVGGGRLSRGLTIEGLAISFFARQADLPTEDTLLQLSRWYGYRGPHLDLCRVVTGPSVAAELVWAHEHDRELRARLFQLARDRRTPREAGVILSSIPHGLPTAKLGIGKVRDVCFSPWTRVFNYVECGALAVANQTVAEYFYEEVRTRQTTSILRPDGSVRGLVSAGWSSDDVIEVLEGLQFTDHNPDGDQSVFGAAYRKCDRDRPTRALLPEDRDPYAVAAYLRYWKAEVGRVGGPTPVFNACVAFGSERTDDVALDFPLSNREVMAGGFVNGGWVGRSDNWPGDQFFDLGGSACESVRKADESGLMLMYVIHKVATGRRGRGIARSAHSPMFGIVVPDGGPTLRRVVVAPRVQNGT